MKVSDKLDPSELVKLCEILNPHNKPGRLTLITRMGAENMRVKLPHLIRAVRQAGLIVTWVSDPMHGNTMKAPCGLKTRAFDAIRVRTNFYLNKFKLSLGLEVFVCHTTLFICKYIHAKSEFYVLQKLSARAQTCMHLHAR